jgi:hypothetical protein
VRARELAVRWIGGYWETAKRHYEFGGEHFAKTKGYEFYAAMSEAQRRSAEKATEAYLDLQVWGTPAMCRDRIVKTADRMGAEQFTCVQLRGHAVHRGRAESAPVRERGDAGPAAGVRRRALRRARARRSARAGGTRRGRRTSAPTR